ncbi:MAG: hypothetical protein E6Q97_38870 [Desulfurellales bacterium]|nr:MAG: hypothetical protein E6Q97_38870 [Desulfurellales bacterium]
MKPEFFTDEDISELPPLTRILFIGLWCAADSEGRMEDRPKFFKVTILPYDDCDVEMMLQVLHEGKFINRYEADGERLIQIPKFRNHQRISGKEAETKSRFPGPQKQHREATGKHPGSTREAPGIPGREGKGREVLRMAATPTPPVPDQQNAKINAKAPRMPQDESGVSGPGYGTKSPATGHSVAMPMGVDGGSHADSGTPNPAPITKALTPVQKVVLGFKGALGVPENDKGWDEVYFPRYSRPARELVKLFDGNLGRIGDCIDHVSGALERRGLSWTPETIVKHAGDWKNGRLFK